MNEKQIYEKVQERYGSAAKVNDDKYGDTIAKAFGYTEEELTSIPRNANLGLSCGNPLALANLKEGETVIDLGSGAGFDVFLAAKRVGSTGKVIGVDMNKDMLKRANQNKEKAQADNVSFIESFITDIPLPDATVDCIISNCVINLVPESDKQYVFNEMFRLLKSGGRVAISDILAKHELPEHVKDNMALYVGCIAGASQVKDYENYFREAGFADILILDSGSDLNIYNSAKENGKSCKCCGEGVENACCEKTPTCCSGTDPALEGSSKPINPKLEDDDFNELAGSFKIYALKA
ncbi:hypothetical protein LTR41_010645 [Exophiala xenobiotica]|nr:hypothetical protein LTR41_010645 [Exophiala xenobiotica]